MINCPPWSRGSVSSTPEAASCVSALSRIGASRDSRPASGIRRSHARLPLAESVPLFREVKDQWITEPGEVGAQVGRRPCADEKQRRVVARMAPGIFDSEARFAHASQPMDRLASGEAHGSSTAAPSLCRSSANSGKANKIVEPQTSSKGDFNARRAVLVCCKNDPDSVKTRSVRRMK